MANHEIVPTSAFTKGTAERKKSATSFSLPGFASSGTYSANFVITLSCLDRGHQARSPATRISHPRHCPLSSASLSQTNLVKAHELYSPLTAPVVSSSAIWRRAVTVNRGTDSVTMSAAFRDDAILLLYALAFTFCTVAHLERSCAENFWTCAVAGLRVGNRWRPGARAADRCYASGQEHRRVNDLPLRRQDGSGRDLNAGRVEREQ